MADKNKVYILNKIFDGSWNDIDGNISHEIIDFVLTDSGRYYVYNVPYGTCPNWIKVKDDNSSSNGSHEVEYLLLTSESHNKTCYILYRIKLIRKMHKISYSRNWETNDQKKNEMRLIYEQNQICYGGKVISDLIDNSTPLVTFEAEYMEMPSEPIEIKFSEYNYQRNKGYVKSDESPNDYRVLNNKINNTSWIRVGLDPIISRTENDYTTKTFLDLILKGRSEECYTNMLYSLLKEPGMMNRFCQEYSLNKQFHKQKSYKVFREHKLVDGRLDICADNGSQRVVIENKLESGINGLKQNSTSQLTTYYNWALEAEEKPLCFVVAPDYRICSSHSMRHGQLEMEIMKYDPQMKDKYILVSYSNICTFIEKNKKAFSKDYEFYKYIDDIIAAFKRHSYPSKSSYYQSLLQERIDN